MNTYSFDTLTERRNTNSVKYDLLKHIYGKDDLMPMWVADMDFDTPSFIFDAIGTRMKHPVLGYSYRDKEYNNAIKFWLNERHNWDVKSSQISFSPGVVPGLLMAMDAVSEHGDEIIVQQPVYFPFFTTIEENGRRLINNPLVEIDGYYKMDFEDLIAKINSKTKAIIMSNPHNPVGRVWNKDELNKLVDICYENNIVIISDEIHSDIVFAPHTHIPIASLSEKAKKICITFMAPSKTFNMAGLSTSFVIIQNEELYVKYENRLDSFHLRQGNIFGNVATQTAYSAEGALWVDSMVNYIESNIDFAIDFIENNIPKVSALKPEATYLLWINMKELNFDNKQLASFFINEVGIAINQGSIFGIEGEGYVRINLATSLQIVETALVKLKEAIDKL